MAQRRPFLPEPITQPDVRRAKVLGASPSGAAPKTARERATISTLPPPPHEEPKPRERSRRTQPPRKSAVRPSQRSLATATVDEVTADLSLDPRREQENDK
jgi:hypothetical protein